MKYNKLLIGIVLVALVMTGCRKDSYDQVNPNEDGFYLNDAYAVTFSLQLEALWHGINNSYVFWRIDTVDWDARYQQAKPVFAALDQKDTVTNAELTHALDVLCHGLIDHHMIVQVRNLKPGSAQSEFVSYRPRNAEIQSRSYYHPRYSCSEHKQTLLDMQQQGRVTNLDTSDYNGFQVVTCVIDGKYAYLNMNKYYLQFVAFYRENDTEYAHQWQQYQDWLTFCQSDACKGVILDNRGNTGGYIADLSCVVGPFLSQESLLGYSYTKSGLGRLDYSVALPCILHPQLPYLSELPYVVLVDLYSISMAEMSSVAVKYCLHGHVIGERTYGATGPLNGWYQSEYDGTFGNQQGNYYVYTSSHLFDYTYAGVLEGKGLKPDQEVFYDPDYTTTHNDRQLDAALQYLSQQ